MHQEVQTLLSVEDPILHKVIHTVHTPIVVSTNNVFHDLMSCLIEQQIHYRSTKKIFAKLLAKADVQQLTVSNFELLEERGLSTSNLSIKKYEAIHDVLYFFEHNSIDWHTLTDATIRQKLVALKGISDWTVDMILLYTLERKNIVPTDDYHLKKIMSSLYGFSPNRGTKAAIRQIAQQWYPNQSLAVQYLFAWKDFHKKK